MLTVLLLVLVATCTLASNPSNVRALVTDTVVPGDDGGMLFVQRLVNITFHARRIEVWPRDADEPQIETDLPRCAPGEECAFDHDPPDSIECLNLAVGKPVPEWLCTSIDWDAYYEVLTYYDVDVGPCAHADSRVIKRVIDLKDLVLSQ